ncbi:SUKH-3 domain-containing protein [Streptomyces sp. NPDC059378]|uniref:SUKH-3 domain-containing protein n=1 Tax=Streptomyces sp. NPDC059378 TaxID=3346815 RepID=UPI00368BE640
MLVWEYACQPRQLLTVTTESETEPLLVVRSHAVLYGSSAGMIASCFELGAVPVMSKWSQEVLEVLEASGWTAGRRVDTAGWRSRFEAVGIVMHDAAEKFLQEFGGLIVNIGGPGINCAREPFELDPELAWGEDDRFSEWSDSLGRRLFPLGELDHGRFFLGIDEDSEIYLVETWVASFGSMPHALENLILGVMPRRIDDDHRQSDQAR